MEKKVKVDDEATAIRSRGLLEHGDLIVTAEALRGAWNKAVRRRRKSSPPILPTPQDVYIQHGPSNLNTEDTRFVRVTIIIKRGLYYGSLKIGGISSPRSRLKAVTRGQIYFSRCTRIKSVLR
jgi:hypothetical protein